MLTIPTQPIPNQTMQTQLAGQACTLNIRQLAYGLFMDVLVDGVTIIAGVIAENRNRIVRSAYLGFTGDFIFVDMQGSDDPVFTGLGDRFVLIFLEEADLP